MNNFLIDLSNKWQNNELRFDDAIKLAFEAGEKGNGDSKFNFISASKKLPEPQSITKVSAPYYLVRTEKFGIQRAMYLRNEDGEVAWYVSYLAKLIVSVIEWGEISDDNQS